MQFPFPADTINSNRFHGVIQGTFELENGTLRLRTPFGLIRLYPRPAKDGKRPFRAAYLNLRDNPGAGVNVYGYPRTNEKGIVERLEMVSFHMVGSPDPDGPLSVSRRFEPGQLFLCGRVRGLRDGLLTVKVKSVLGDRDLSWRVTGMLAGEAPKLHSKVLFSCGLAADGLLVVRPLKVIALPGQATSVKRRLGHPSSIPVSRTSGGTPAVKRHPPAASAELPQALPLPRQPSPVRRRNSQNSSPVPFSQNQSARSTDSSDVKLRRSRQQNLPQRRRESLQGLNPLQRPQPVPQRRLDGRNAK